MPTEIFPRLGKWFYNMNDFLHLNGWKTLAVHESENDYHVEAEITEQAPTFCRECFKYTEIVKFGTRKQVVLDSPTRGKRVGIHVARQRYQCLKCKTIMIQSLPDCSDSRRATNRLVRLIAKKSLLETFSSVAREVDIVEGSVRNIFKSWVQEKDKFYQPVTPEILGIDEINIIRPRCVMTNIGQHAIFDILSQRNKINVIARLDKMETSNVKIAAIDMWRPYREAVEIALPKAIVVVDKFHVVRMANDALEGARRQMRKELSHHYVLQLKDDRHLLLKRRHKLDDFQKLKIETWTKNFPLLGEAYDSKERFYDFYDCQSRSEAETFLRDWKNSLSPDAEKTFGVLLKALHNWREYILNYFDTPRTTNAYTESLNSLIRLVNRNGRGYSFDVIRAKVLYSDGVRIAPNPVYNKDYKHSGILYCVAAPTSEEDYGASISILIKQFEKEAE